uniref:Si:ch211-241f5.3 n=1 Tax=Sinocyclocheilus rhinocerous TaxID=307959 RepID=A0A673FTC5_9TELE
MVIQTFSVIVIEDNECVPQPSICGENARCINTVGSYYCQCHEGFTTLSTHNFTQADSISCKDINECVVGSADCGPNTICVNSEGGYKCTCATGYISSNSGQGVQSDSISCKDIDECVVGSADCGPNTKCVNSEGGYKCTCATGYISSNSGQGVQCIDINECVDGSPDCGPNTKCVNSEGGYNCTCATGYISSNGKEIFNAGQGVQCIGIKQFYPTYFLSSNVCFKHHLDPQISLISPTTIQALLCDQDDLLHGGFNGDNDIVSAFLRIVVIILKLIGHLLSASRTRKIYVELLVKRGNSPPEGHFMMNTSGAQLTSHWDTATGNTYLGFTTAALLSYKGLEESLNCCFNHLETQQKQTFKINSKVVTATFSNYETTNLKKPIKLTFSHLTNEKHMCVFWDPELEGGAWSTRGCTTVRSSADQTVCSCSKLGSFAVMTVLCDTGDVYELRLVTLVGLPLSLICLLICIVTFYFVRSIQSTRNTIHLHLCISLFIAYFVFVVGITLTENKVGCAVVAGILHYFFLASFCWMCLEGVQLFRMVVLVFNTTLRPIYMFATGYGVPVVIVAISATVNNFRFVSDDGFIWSFYGPVCVIIIVNVLFFLITIWKLAEKFSSLNPDLDSLHKIKAFTVTAIAQLCILGIMWVFGCFQFDENTLPMSYIFTILSSLQGVLMFILHCWLSKQVREEYAKFLSCICAPHKRKYSEFTSNQTSKLQVNSVSKRSRLALALRMCAQNLPSGCPRCR